MNDAAPWIDPELVAAGRLLQEKGLVAPDRTVASLAEVRAATDRIGAFLGEVNPILITQNPVWIYSLFIFIPGFILFLYFIIRYNPSFKNISQEEMRSFSAFSSIVLITNLIQFVAFRADYWLISIFYDHASVGIYAQASKFAQLLWIIPGILAGLITPALKNNDHTLTEPALMSVSRASFYIHLLLCFVRLMWVLSRLPSLSFRSFID